MRSSPERRIRRAAPNIRSSLQEQLKLDLNFVFYLHRPTSKLDRPDAETALLEFVLANCPIRAVCQARPAVMDNGSE